jgi:peptide chain release factor subunit 1
MPTVKGIVMAGSADFKTVIGASDTFDKRLQNITIATFDIQYGFEDGLNHAISQAGDALANVRFCEEKVLITNFFEQINLDTGMIVFGVNDTMKALEMSAIDKVLLFDEIDITRYEIVNPSTGKTSTWYLTPKQAEDPKYFKDPSTGVEMEVTN